MMLESIKSYPLLWIALAVLIVIAVIVGRKASAAVSRRYGTMRKQEAEIERLKELVGKYEEPTVQTVTEAGEWEVVDGISAVLQKKLNRSENAEKTFDEAEEWKKQIYALGLLKEDSWDRLSDFFRTEGDGIVRLAFAMLENIDEKNVLAVMKRMYPMFDENNDSVSVDKALVDELDGKFRDVFDAERTDKKVKEFAIQNLQITIDK